MRALVFIFIKNKGNKAYKTRQNIINQTNKTLPTLYSFFHLSRFPLTLPCILQNNTEKNNVSCVSNKHNKEQG